MGRRHDGGAEEVSTKPPILADHAMREASLLERLDSEYVRGWNAGIDAALGLVSETSTAAERLRALKERLAMTSTDADKGDEK